MEVTSAREIISTFEKGQLRRHTSSTQMNRESSRSHLIMSIMIEATNLQTQNITRGKLSFVDLAGSERYGAHPPGPLSMVEQRRTIDLFSLQLWRCWCRLVPYIRISRPALLAKYVRFRQGTSTVRLRLVMASKPSTRSNLVQSCSS